MKINSVIEYLKIYHKNGEQTYEEKLALKEYNKALCERYPFLIPHNRWSGKPITTKEKGFFPNSPEIIPEYDYEYTELDEMPEGWRIAFGDDMLEELRAELVRCDYLDEYMIVQLKEKFGSLRIYDNGIPQNCKVWDIISKYETISETTCINCGKPARWLSKGWISPYCDDCINMEQSETYYNKIEEDKA